MRVKSAGILRPASMRWRRLPAAAAIGATAASAAAAMRAASAFCATTCALRSAGVSRGAQEPRTPPLPSAAPPPPPLQPTSSTNTMPTATPSSTHLGGTPQNARPPRFPWYFLSSLRLMAVAAGAEGPAGAAGGSPVAVAVGGERRRKRGRRLQRPPLTAATRGPPAPRARLDAGSWAHATPLAAPPRAAPPLRRALAAARVVFD
mmetsp:Transcript_3581/g.13040  ORF Transcript_3581/g.13040 Transcript_3581/m.13040 type:complete len:205 (+) Transcript_3581:709-1323(+)